VVTDETDPMIGGRSCERLDRDRDHVHEAIAWRVRVGHLLATNGREAPRQSSIGSRSFSTRDIAESYCSRKDLDSSAAITAASR
jgi:hypothetical protein